FPSDRRLSSRQSSTVIFARSRPMSSFRALATISLASLVCLALSSPARAQGVSNKDAAAAVRASFVSDLDGLRTKFVALAEAFPQDKYAWRPMDGVRSVS